MSERPPPFPLCMRMRKIRPRALATSITMYTQVSADTGALQLGTEFALETAYER
jgi:hypothetical protein